MDNIIFQKLFSNISQKIKSLAKWILIAGIVAAVVSGIFLIGDHFLLAGILLLIAGPVLTSIISLLIYGLGQLIENTEIILQSAHENQK